MNTVWVTGTTLLIVALAVVFMAVVKNFFASTSRGPMSTKPFRSKKKGVSDLLQWAALWKDGVVLTKGGGLVAGYYFRGPDTASSTPEERNHITARVNAALARMGDGWVTWTECVRVEAQAYFDPDASHFPDEVDQLIEDERRVNFTSEGRHYESDFALMVMYTPPLRRNSKIAELVYDDESVDRSADPAPRLLTQFERALSDIEDYLFGTIRLQRMKSYSKREWLPDDTTEATGPDVLYDETVNFLNYCLTGEMIEVRIPPIPMYMDAYMGGQELWAGDTPKYGDKFIQCINIEGFPEQSRPNLLSFLDQMAMPYRWSTRFIYLDQHSALKELNKYRRKWKQKEKGFFSQVFRIQSGQVNQDALLMGRQADASIADAQSAMVTFGYYTSVIVMMDESRDVLEARARDVVRELRRTGFNGRVETVNTVQAWAGSLPGHPEPNIRRPVMHTLNLADLLPLSSVWAGRATNPNPLYPPNSPALLQAATTGATPFRINLHVGDLGHSLVLGPTGAGKSTLLATLCAQFMRYQDATVAAFDNGRSLYAWCKAVGGSFYDLGADGDTTGCAPLQYIDSDSDLTWASEWLGNCYTLQTDKSPTPRQKDAITQALKLMRESKEGRSLTDFCATCQDQDVRDAIKHYTIDGSLGRLLDARQDDLREGRVMVFEISELMSMGDKNMLPVLLYLFRRVDKMARGQPGLMLVDEAWVPLGHPVFREQLRGFLKKKRKDNWAMVLATQSLSDTARSGILDVLMESCPTKIYLPNEEADKRGTPDTPGPYDLYKMFGLNDTEVSIIKNAQKKRHYYFTSTEGRRLFDLALGPIALAFVAVSDKESIAEVKRLEKLFGAQWPFEWLRAKNIKVNRHENRKRAA